MRRNKKRFIVVVICCLLLCGSAISVYAETHSHALSYVGDYELGTTVVGSHSHPICDSNGNMTNGTCVVKLRKWQAIKKCACGMVEKGPVQSKVTHSLCGQ